MPEIMFSAIRVDNFSSFFPCFQNVNLYFTVSFKKSFIMNIACLFPLAKYSTFSLSMRQTTFCGAMLAVASIFGQRGKS